MYYLYMYIFLAVAALYTFYIFHSKYFKENMNNEDNENDGYLDEVKDEVPTEPKEVELIEQKVDKENDEFLEEDDKKGWFW